MALSIKSEITTEYETKNDIDSQTRSSLYNSDDYNKFLEFSNIKNITFNQLLGINSLAKSFYIKNKTYPKKSVWEIKVFDFYSKEAMFLLKLMIEKKCNIKIINMKLKKINTGIYKITFEIMKNFSDSIKDAIDILFCKKDDMIFTRCLSEQILTVVSLIDKKLKENNTSSFKLSIHKNEIQFLCLNSKLIYITIEYIKKKFNKDVCNVKREIKQNERTFYFECFSKKTTELLQDISNKLV